jgi:hypothetical protein
MSKWVVEYINSDDKNEKTITPTPISTPVSTSTPTTVSTPISNTNTNTNS